MSFASFILGFFWFWLRKILRHLAFYARWSNAAIRLPVGGCTGGLKPWRGGCSCPLYPVVLNNLLVPLCGHSPCSWQNYARRNPCFSLQVMLKWAMWFSHWRCYLLSLSPASKQSSMKPTYARNKHVLWWNEFFHELLISLALSTISCNLKWCHENKCALCLSSV